MGKGKQPRKAGTRMGLKTAIRRMPRRAVKKSGPNEQVEHPTPESTPKDNIYSYLRRKAAKHPMIKSELQAEIMEGFKPQFHDIKELAKSAPELALSCIPVESLQKNAAPPPPPPPAPESDEQAGRSAPVTGGYNKAQMAPKKPPMPKGPAATPPKAPAASTPKPPKAPSMQTGPKKPKGMAMGKEEMGKGDVIRIDDKKKISDDKNPASMRQIAHQHKGSKYAPMKPALVNADGTRAFVDKHRKPYKKEEKGKEVKTAPDGVQTSAGSGKNWPVKEQGKQSGKDGLNITTPENGTKKNESCYAPSPMIKEELEKEWSPKFAKFQAETPNQPAPVEPSEMGTDEPVDINGTY